jgi:hypothetical protein
VVTLSRCADSKKKVLAIWVSKIVKSQGFLKAKIPNLEVVWVYYTQLGEQHQVSDFCTPLKPEGMIYLLFLGPHSPIHVNLAFTFTALVIAKMYVSSPFVISYSARR